MRALITTATAPLGYVRKQEFREETIAGIFAGVCFRLYPDAKVLHEKMTSGRVYSVQDLLLLAPEAERGARYLMLDRMCRAGLLSLVREGDLDAPGATGEA